jgi:hypothetical protein
VGVGQSEDPAGAAAGGTHPGQHTARRIPRVAAWKKRLRTRTIRTPGGGEQAVARESADDALMAVRAFYLDLAQC